MGILDNMGGGNFQMGLLGLAGLGSLFENRGPRYTTNIAEATTPRENPFMAQLPGQMALIARQEQERRRNDLLTQMQQDQMAEKRRQQEARARFAASLPPTMDPAQRAYAEVNPDKVYESQFGGVLSAPALAQKRMLSAEERAAAMDQWRQQQVLPQEAVDQRTQIQRAGQILPEEAVRQRIQIANQSREPRMLSPAEEEQQIRMATAKAAAMAAAKPPPKLEFGARKELSELGGIASRFDGLNSTFKDNYAGYKSDAIGEFALKAGRNVPGTPGAAPVDAADWWQGYQDHKNLVRNKLFGSALTSTERDEFDKAQITPGMAPELVKKNLARQNAAARSAAAKLAESYLADGVDSATIEATLGYKLSDLKKAAAPKADLKSKYGLE